MSAARGKRRGSVVGSRQHLRGTPCRACGDSLRGLPVQRRYCYECRPDLKPGFQYGNRTAVELVRTAGGKRGWLMRCACGDETVLQEQTIWRNDKGLSCRQCWAPQEKKTGAERMEAVYSGDHAPTLAHGADGPPYALNELPFDEDPECQRFVDEHPSGATLEEIAACFGLSRERVRQIEEVALKKLLTQSRRRFSGHGWGSTSFAGATNHERIPTTPVRERGGQR